MFGQLPCPKYMSKSPLLLGSAIVLLLAVSFMYTRMPTPYRALGPLREEELAARDHLRADVRMLAESIGGRDGIKYAALGRAADYIADELRSASYSPERQWFSADGKQFQNIEAELRGTDHHGRLIIVGAHYDTAGGLPGANDNGSGVAACLELARRFARLRLKNNIRWVFFANEEPPYFQTPAMGSFVYAKRCHERDERVAAMLSLET